MQVDQEPQSQPLVHERVSLPQPPVPVVQSRVWVWPLVQLPHDPLTTSVQPQPFPRQVLVSVRVRPQEPAPHCSVWVCTWFGVQVFGASTSSHSSLMVVCVYWPWMSGSSWHELTVVWPMHWRRMMRSPHWGALSTQLMWTSVGGPGAQPSQVPGIHEH